MGVSRAGGLRQQESFSPLASPQRGITRGGSSGTSGTWASPVRAASSTVSSGSPRSQTEFSMEGGGGFGVRGRGSSRESSGRWQQGDESQELGEDASGL